MTQLAFRVRAARPTDVPTLMRFERLLAENEGGLSSRRSPLAARTIRHSPGNSANSSLRGAKRRSNPDTCPCA